MVTRGSQRYIASSPPSRNFASEHEFRRWVEDELRKVQSAFEFMGARHFQLEEIHNAPKKPRTGLLAYADGSNWDPNAGEGPHIFDGTRYVPLFPPTKNCNAYALQDATVTGLTSGTWNRYSSTIVAGYDAGSNFDLANAKFIPPVRDGSATYGVLLRMELTGAGDTTIPDQTLCQVAITEFNSSDVSVKRAWVEERRLGNASKPEMLIAGILVPTSNNYIGVESWANAANYEVKTLRWAVWRIA